MQSFIFSEMNKASREKDNFRFGWGFEYNPKTPKPQTYEFNNLKYKFKILSSSCSIFLKSKYIII